MSEVKAKIKGYLSRLIGSYDLKDDEDIFSLGIVHSMFSIQLILFVEKEFGIEIEDDELDLENLRTVNAIAALLEKKQSGM